MKAHRQEKALLQDLMHLCRQMTHLIKMTDIISSKNRQIFRRYVIDYLSYQSFYCLYRIVFTTDPYRISTLQQTVLAILGNRI